MLNFTFNPLEDWNKRNLLCFNIHRSIQWQMPLMKMIRHRRIAVTHESTHFGDWWLIDLLNMKVFPIKSVGIWNRIQMWLMEVIRMMKNIIAHEFSINRDLSYPMNMKNHEPNCEIRSKSTILSPFPNARFQ
jgi:hypothetical protein